MSRSLSYQALTLRVRASGESNREAWFLSAEEGIFKATVFGGPKSRLRSQVAPFHQGRLWIYRDPVRDSRKVTDFDVRNWRPGLRELYERTMAADALAETGLATHGGGGGWGTALRLAGEALDSLEKADEKTCTRIILHFLWAWTEFLGSKPDLSRCVSCACEVPGDTVLWYEPGEGGLYCDTCRSDSGISLRPGARRWLLAIQNVSSRESLRYNLDNSSLQQARTLVLGILCGILGKRLPLWDEF